MSQASIIKAAHVLGGNWRGPLGLRHANAFSAIAAALFRNHKKTTVGLLKLQRRLNEPNIVDNDGMHQRNGR